MRVVPLSFALLAAIVLCACGHIPRISQVGPDTWAVETGQSWHGREVAGEYCAKMGKLVLVTNMEQRYTGATVIFRCLRSDDPDYRRPDYQKPPNTVIQDNRQK